jgi:hypothetical protein
LTQRPQKTWLRLNIPFDHRPKDQINETLPEQPCAMTKVYAMDQPRWQLLCRIHKLLTEQMKGLQMDLYGPNHSNTRFHSVCHIWFAWPVNRFHDKDMHTHSLAIKHALMCNIQAPSFKLVDTEEDAKCPLFKVPLLATG